MKIKRLRVANVTSYGESTQFEFDSDLNIIIGPNGGGKTNLQRILALTLSNYFIHQYDFVYNDNERDIKAVNMFERRALQRALSEHVAYPGQEQLIELELVPEDADVLNINSIHEHLSDFNEQLAHWEKPRPEYEPHRRVTEIQASHSFTYVIRDLKLETPERNSAAWAYLEYLRTLFIFIRLAERVPSVSLTSPVFFFSSERTAKRNLRVEASQLTAEQHHTGFRSAYQAAMGGTTGLLQWGAQHFARLHLKAERKASRSEELVVDTVLNEDPDVVLLTQYLEELGYGLELIPDDETLSYEFAIWRPGGVKTLVSADMFSSGELEIIHFLLAMFALNVRDGLILIDEPELHLHPRWQRIILSLFRSTAADRNNQLIVATHSPVFVAPDTVENVTRVYRRPNGNSARICLRDVELPDKKHLVRMINSQNNERLFFADKVVLVEGLWDRLAISSLLDLAASNFRNYEAIEVIEVGGKHNLSEYRSLLEALDTPCFVVADLDYLQEVGSPAVRGMFEPNQRKQWDILGDKKSRDAATAASLIREALDGGDKELLRDFVRYIETRSSRLSTSLDQDDQAILQAEIETLASQRCFVLADGEIEDYLPASIHDIRSLVDMTNQREWINSVRTASRREELAIILCRILGETGADADRFQRLAKSGEIIAVDPYSEASEESNAGPESTRP